MANKKSYKFERTHTKDICTLMFDGDDVWFKKKLKGILKEASNFLEEPAIFLSSIYVDSLVKGFYVFAYFGKKSAYE